MAIRATFKDSSKTIPDAYLKIDRIWGSKLENWNAWINVYSNETSKEALTTFSVHAPYVEDENPYVALYTALSNLSFLSNIHHDLGSEWKQVCSFSKLLTQPEPTVIKKTRKPKKV